MRRPRSKLQVSTFPFLAVLLCAMGALLLLLFMMDRRAKIAAQHTVADAVAQRKQRTQEEEAARQAEWEKARALLHQSLLAQQNQLLADAKGIQQNVAGVNQKFALVQANHLDLQSKAKDEAAQIAALSVKIAGQRAGLSDVDKKELKSKAELIEAAKELDELELAFQALRKLRERDKEVYSIVPYHGKRGDARTPIYVECCTDSVIFHPDEKVLDRYTFAPDLLRREVEHRAGAPLGIERTAKEKSRTMSDVRKGPYVLFLVRPEGIATYYKSQAALKGYELDFGYELVDSDWVLDFNGDPNAKPMRPAALAKNNSVRPTPRPGEPVILPILPLNGGPGNGSGGPQGTVGSVTMGSGLPPIALPSPVAGIGPPGMPGGGALGNPSYPRSNPGIPGQPPGFGAGGGTPGGIPPLGSGDPGTAGRPPGFVGPGGTPGTPPTGIPSLGSGDPGTSARPPVPVGPGGAPGTPPTGIPSVGSGEPATPRPPAFVPINKSTAPPTAIAASGGLNSGTGSAPSGQSGGQGPGDPNQASASPLGGPPQIPIPGSNVGGKPGSGSDVRSGDPDSGEPPSSGKTMPTFNGGGAPKKAAPASSPAMSRLFGNRDFVITIDCFAEHITVTPSGLQYRWTTANSVEVDKAIVQTVTNLIARRQSSARPGDPPYRPIINFNVATDGLRSYHRVYPLLEHLRVPMLRENVPD